MHNAKTKGGKGGLEGKVGKRGKRRKKENKGWERILTVRVPTMVV
jgi:hypothetical protein